MARKPRTFKEAELRDAFQNAHEEAINPQHYRQIRRKIKKEMKRVDKQINQKEFEEALEGFLNDE